MAVYQGDLSTVVTNMQEQINRLSAAVSSKPSLWVPNVTQSVTQIAPSSGSMDWSLMPSTDPCPVTVVNGKFMVEIWTKALVQNVKMDVSYRVYPDGNRGTTSVPLPTVGSSQDGLITWTDYSTGNSLTIFPGNVRQIVSLANGLYWVELWWRKSVNNTSYPESSSLYGRTIITRTL